MTSVLIFKGLRYATAERFAPPVPADVPFDPLHTGEPGATGEYGPQCPQVLGIMEQVLGQGSLPSAEDCHFLNVFTPARDDRQRPVMVWVHGGAFTNGTGATPWYHGASLAERYDVVVVTINYRLGAFGYLHLADHGGEEFTDSGNLGLLDQIEALRWVQRHIGSFGGDPGNVTIFGESAGGASVLSLMASPFAAGLFHQAVALSPSIVQFRGRERARDVAEKFLAAAGTDIAGLRSLPVEQFLEAQQQMLRGSRDDVFTAFAPTPGEPSMPGDVVTLAAANPVPLVVGTTRDEMRLFTMLDPSFASMDEARLVELASKLFGEGTGAAIDAYRRHRSDTTPGGVAAAIATDASFRVPARRLAEARVALGHPTWMHWFTWATPAFGGMFGSCHALDIPFVFHNLTRNGVEAFTGHSVEREPIAATFSRAVTAFARAGDPGWSPYDTDTRATMRIDVDSAEMSDPEPELRRLWEAVS